jgi:oligopeptidase A
MSVAPEAGEGQTASGRVPDLQLCAAFRRAALTRIDWPQVNGLNNVEWDAVELPSQLLENWCWEEEILGRYARHYKDGNPMPDELKDRLLKSRTFHKALFLVRQLEYAICDIRLHLEYDPEIPANPLQVLDQVREQVAVVPVPEGCRGARA